MISGCFFVEVEIFKKKYVLLLFSSVGPIAKLDLRGDYLYPGLVNSGKVKNPPKSTRVLAVLDS